MRWRGQWMAVWPSPRRWGGATTGSRPTAGEKGLLGVHPRPAAPARRANISTLLQVPGAGLMSTSQRRSRRRNADDPSCGETCRLSEGGGAQLVDDQLREPTAHVERPLLGGHRWSPWDEARLLGLRHVLADGLADDPERRRSPPRHLHHARGRGRYWPDVPA